MDARDESARTGAEGGSPPGRALPAGADYRGLVEGLPLIVYIDAPDAISPSLYVSPQTTEILGYTPEDWASSADFFVSILHPDDRERVVAETAHLLATGERLKSEYRLLRRDGRVAWVRDEGMLVCDAAGEPLCMQGYILDITERREREAAVHRSDARTRAMLDAALDGVVTIDHEGAILEFNPAAEGIFGYARDAVMGRQMAELIVPPALRGAHSAGFRHYLATGEGPVLGTRIEVSGMRADGSEFPSSSASQPSRCQASPSSPPICGTSASTSCARQRCSRARPSWTPRSRPSSAARATAGSRAGTRQRSASSAIAPRRSSARPPISSRSPDSGVIEYVDGCLRRGEVVKPIEVVCIRKDGKHIDVESTISPIIGAAGEIVGSSSITRDITERKRSQALAAGQAELLEFVAGGAELPRVLEKVARFVEEHGGDVLASILLLDRDGVHLRHGAAPSLPRVVLRGHRRGGDRPERGLVRHRGLSPRARVRHRHRERPAAGAISASRRSPQASAPAGRHRSSRPTIRCSGRSLSTTARPRECGEGEIELVELATHVAGIAIERTRNEDAARVSEERYRDLFENAGEPIATVTMGELITEVNRAFERVLGYGRDELIGTNLADYLTPESLEMSAQATARKLSGEATGTTFEQEFIAKDGHSVILEVSSRVIEQDGHAVGVQGICRDVTARKQADLELRRLSELNRHQSLHDSLTGLPNRVSFAQQIEHAIRVADQEGSQLAVLVMDLDRFKEINDTLGHRYGDLLLVELARRLESVLRRSDTVARLGGDEFGILVRQLSAAEADLEQALERILAALEQPFQVDGLPLHVEASIGIARFPLHGHDVDVLLQRADVAMYLAKDTGAPHAVYAPELDRHDAAGLTLLSELPRAMRNRELVLHYQPKLNVRTGELSGLEALVRWQHPTRGLIAPGEFVPAAEKTALIQPLTRYVLDAALEQLARWNDDGHRFKVAVNLSMRNLHDPGLPAEVTRLLQRVGNARRASDRRDHRERDRLGSRTDSRRDPRTQRSRRRRLDRRLRHGLHLARLSRPACGHAAQDRSFVRAQHGRRRRRRRHRPLHHHTRARPRARGRGRGSGDEGHVRQAGRARLRPVQGYWLSRPLPPGELTEWLASEHERPGEAAA